MTRRPPSPTRTDTLCPYTTLCRSIDVAIDLRRVCLAAAGGADAVVLIRLADLVDDDGQGAADLRGEFRGADRGGLFHDALVTLFLDRFGHRVGQGVRLRAGDGFEAKGADAVELRFVEPEIGRAHV